MTARWSKHRPLLGAYVLALCTVVLAAVTLFVWPKLFAATPDSVAQLVTATCGAESQADGPPSDAAQPCPVSVLPISPGRFRVEAGDPGAERLTLDFQIPTDTPRWARVLLVWAWQSPEDLAVEAFGLERSGSGLRIEPREDVTGSGRRRLFELDPSLDVQQIRVVVRRGGGEGRHARGLCLDEVGLYASAAGLGRDVRPFLPDLLDRLVCRGVLAHKVDEVVLASDRLRYWALVLDPARLLSGLPR